MEDGPPIKRLRVIISPTPNVYVINMVQMTSTGLVAFHHAWSSSIAPDLEAVLFKTYKTLASQVVGAITIRIPDDSQFPDEGDALRTAAGQLFDEKHAELLGSAPIDVAARAAYCERMLANLQAFTCNGAWAAISTGTDVAHVAPLPKYTVLFMHRTPSIPARFAYE
jgi:hypothetical protein